MTAFAPKVEEVYMCCLLQSEENKLVFSSNDIANAYALT